MTNIRHFKIEVQGRVQGVWFRKYTKEAADSFGVCGYVCNRADGSVYLEAEGEEEQLQKLLTWLEKGSPLSRVTRVLWDAGDMRHYASFEVRR